MKEKHIDIITFEFEDIKLQLDRKWTVEAVAVLDNAVKYSPRGSNVHICVQKMYSFVQIEIRKTGTGNYPES